MEATSMIAEIAKRARVAARTLANSTTEQRNQVLLNIADELEKNLDLNHYLNFFQLKLALVDQVTLQYL